MSLPDGVFPRLNASMIHSGKYNNSIASVIGKSISFDGASTLEFECVDGGKVQVQVNPEFNFVPGRVMEVMGSVQDDGSIQVRIIGVGDDVICLCAYKMCHVKLFICHCCHDDIYYFV